MLPVFILASPLLFAAGSSPHLLVETCDVGETYEFSQAGCQVMLENSGDAPIRVSDIKAESPADSVETRELTVAPHSRSYLNVHVVAGSHTGSERHVFHWRTDDAGLPDVRVTVRGFVISILDADPELDFGIVDLDANHAVQTARLDSHDVTDFRVTRLIDKPAWIDVTISPDGHAIEAKVRPDAPLGLYAEFIKLSINSPQQPQAWIQVKADIRGDVVPATNPLVMGLLRNNVRNEFRIPLVNRHDKPFTVGKIELDGVSGDVRVDHCVPDKASCHWLNLVLSAKQPQGTIKGNLFVELPDQKKRLKIALRGLLVDKDFEVKQLDADAISKKASERPSSSSSNSVDLSKAIKGAVQEANEVAPPGAGPLLKWTVSNGLTIHGFQIFRSADADGPFVLLNRETIRSKAEDENPSSYSYRDNNVVSGKTYWYYIGIVYGDGHKQQLTTPQKIVAK